MERRMERRMRDNERVDYATFNVNKYKKKGKWTIVGALDCVLQLAQDSELCDEFWDSAKAPLKYLRTTLGLTDMQIIVVAIMVEGGESVSWKSLGSYLGVSRLTMMTYSEEVEDLVMKGWIYRSSSYERG